MLIPILIQGAAYRIAVVKRFLIAVILAVAGTLGTMLLFRIENGGFGGTSFYGAVFFVPVFLFPVAYLLKMRFGELMDLCAPAECAMLVIMKIQCLLSDCCGGVEIAWNGSRFVFPSQMAELLTAVVICIVLLRMSLKEKNRGSIFPAYMVIYGVTRFVLNIFRKTGIVPHLHMPYGNFWSLVSIAIGVIWLVIVAGRKRRIYNDCKL